MTGVNRASVTEIMGTNPPVTAKFLRLMFDIQRLTSHDDAVEDQGTGRGVEPDDLGLEQPVRSKLFQFVEKTGSSIRNRVVNVKTVASGNRFGCTNYITWSF